MPKHKDTLPYLIAAVKNSKLMERRDDKFVFTIGRTERPFPAELVAEVHPYLPRLIDAMSEHTKWDSARFVRKTLAHWIVPSTKLEEEGVYINQPTAIMHDADTAQYSIRTTRYKVIVNEYGDEMVVNIAKKIHLPVTSEWLDKTYPGLRIKYVTLIALGVFPTEASKQALSEVCKTDANVELSEIVFDDYF